MTAIVMNTMTGAVSEYDWAFQSITPNFAGDTTGLYALGGDTDAGLPIVPVAILGKTLMGGAARARIDNVFFGLQTPGQQATCIVKGQGATYSYDFTPRADGMSRVEPGKGLRENYLAVGFTNDGADFRIDQIEVDVQQSTRRIS